MSHSGSRYLSHLCPRCLVVTWCWWPPKAVFQLWLSLYGVKCQGIEQKLLALGGISTFSVDVLVLCVRSFPARRAQTALEPSLEITLKSHHCSLKSEKCGTGQPGLSTDKQPSRLQFPIELQFSQSDSFNEQRNFSFFLLFLACPGAVALLQTEWCRNWSRDGSRQRLLTFWSCSVAFSGAPETFCAALSS